MSSAPEVEANAGDTKAEVPPHRDSKSEMASVHREADVHSVVDGIALPLNEDIETGIADPKARQHTWLIILALCSAMFVVSLNTFIMTTALPTIAVDFATSDVGYAWIGSAYMLAFGVVVPVWANISNIFGRRVILIVTNVFFFVGTLTGALSSNAAVLIAGRAIQGCGGGGLTVLVNLCVGDLFGIR